VTAAASVPRADGAGGERFQGGEVVGGELDAEGGGVLLDPLHPLGSGDRDDGMPSLAPWAATQATGSADSGRGRTSSAGPAARLACTTPRSATWNCTARN
jgi:hypothetical protein